MAITISDGTDTITYDGDWVHVPQKRSPLASLADPDFRVDRGTFSLRMIPLLCDKGLTHVYGSECSAVKSTYEKKAGVKLSDSDAAAMIREAQTKMREDMENDRWATGQRTRTPTLAGDKQSQMFASRVAGYVRNLINGAFERDGDKWIDSEGNAYPLPVYVEAYLANGSASEGVPEVVGFAGPGVTLGSARRAMHMAAVEKALAESAGPKTGPTI